MSRRRVVLAPAIALCAATALGASPASADLPASPVTVSGGYGVVDTAITLPGTTEVGTIVQVVGGGTTSGPAVTCSYTLDTSNQASHPGDYPGLHVPGHQEGADGSYYYRTCSNGLQGLVWVPNGNAPAAAGVPTVTPAQLALEARDRLVLPHPTAHRSPTETNRFQGSPFTWVNLWTWVWTDPGDYQPLTSTLSVGPVSATVRAKPVALMIDPGDGSGAVRCAGPGRAWTESDGDAAPPGGCGTRYAHVTDGPVTSRLAIVWEVTWTGSGGTGGTLPAMQTVTAAPVRVLQAQVVNR